MNNIKAPIDYSKYDRTYNNAIDLVAQAIGYAKKSGRALRTIVLEPQTYVLFKKGIEILAKKEFPHEQEFTFEGILVSKGDVKKFERVRLIWWDERLN